MVFRHSGVEIGNWGLRFWVWGLGFGFRGVKFVALRFELGGCGLWFVVGNLCFVFWGLGFGVWGLEFMV